MATNEPSHGILVFFRLIKLSYVLFICIKGPYLNSKGQHSQTLKLWMLSENLHDPPQLLIPSGAHIKVTEECIKLFHESANKFYTLQLKNPFDVYLIS